jgi:hypothetical protein
MWIKRARFAKITRKVSQAMSQVMMRRHAHNPQYRLTTRDFLRRRFVRIYPVLFCALVLTFVRFDFEG